MISLGLVVLFIADTALRRISDDFSEQLITRSFDGIETNLRDLFADIELELRIVRQWWESGRLDFEQPDDLERLNGQFMPLLSERSAIASMMLANSRGFEYMLLRNLGSDTEFAWYNRVIRKDLGPEEGFELFWPKDDTPGERQALTGRLLDYDPRRRRFYADAPLGQVTWTRPSHFFTTRDAGMTASYKWRDPESDEIRMVGFDLLLRDLSRLTANVNLSRNGKVFVLSSTGKLIGLPADSRWPSAADIRRTLRAGQDHGDSAPAPDSAARLMTPGELDLPAVSAAREHWQTHDVPNYEEGYAGEMDVDGAPYWIAYRPFDLPTQRLWIGAVVPQRDFLGHAIWQRRALLGALTLAFAIAMLLAFTTAARLRDEIHRRAIAEKGNADILDSAPDAMLVVDPDGRISSANRASSLLFGQSQETLRGSDIDRLIPDEVASAHYENIRSYFRNPRRRNIGIGLELEALHSSGERIPVEISLSPLQTPDGPAATAAIRDVRSRRDAEAHVRRADARLRNMISNMPAVVFRRSADNNSGLIYISDRVEVLTGYPPGHFLGEPATALSNIVHAEDQPRISAALNNSIRSGKAYAVEYRLRRRDGQERWVMEQGRSNREEDGKLWLDGTMLDITAYKRAQARAENALKEAANQSRRLADLTRNLPGVSWRFAVDQNSDRIWFEEFTGDIDAQFHELDVEAIKQDGTLIAEWIHPDDRARFLAEQRSPVQRDYSVADYRALRAPGQYGWLRVYSSRCDGDQPGSLAAVGYIADVDAEKRLLQEVEAARAEADQANAAKSEFLANMSHEIRTPMNALIGMGHLLRHTDLDAQQTHYLERIESASELLMRLLNDILDISKIEAGKLELESRPFRLQVLLTRVGSLMSARAQNRQLELHFKVPANEPDWLKGDALRLEQILQNLTSNAIKFTPEGGEVLLTIAAERSSNNDWRLRFEVRDTGIGLNETEQSRLFQSFAQGDSSITRQYGGTGLGLAICRQLVELMGGRIGVESDKDQGSNFWFELELEEAQAPPDSSASLSSATRHVLVVDDHDTAREIFIDMLEQLGSTCSGAETGEEALARMASAQAGGEPFDLALIDWRMPGTSGMDVINAVRLDPQRYGQPRMIIVTGFDPGQLPPELDVDAVLLKPVCPALLTDTINGLYENGSDSSAADTNNPYEGISLANQTLLIVEDNDINREIAEHILERAGAQVDVASNGQEAIDRLSTPGYRPDAVIMDCQMPLMSGYEASRRIRRMPDFSRLPIIAMTAHALESDRQRCLEAGMNDHVAKPIDVRTLLQTIAGHVQLPASATQSVEHESQARTGRLWSHHYDFEPAIRRAGGDRKLHARLLARFAGECPAFSRQIQQAQTEDDQTKLRERLHHLKGLAMNLGLREIGQQAAAIEQDSDAKPSEITGKIDRLCHLLERCPADLKDLLPAPAAAVQEADENLESKLNSLQALLEEDDAEAILLAQQLPQQLPENLHDAGVELCRACEEYDFGAALLALSEIQDTLGPTPDA